MRAEPPAAELHVTRGARLAESPRVGVYGRWQRHHLETLYVLVDPQKDPGDDVCSTVLKTIDQEFRSAGPSLTSTILRSVGAVNRVLRDLNRRALLEHRVSVGLMCVMRREDEVFVSQSGSLVAFATQDDELSPLLGGQYTGLAGEPLGLSEEADVRLHRYELGSGEGVLMVSGSIGNQLAQEGVNRLAGLRSGSLERLRDFSGPNDTFSAMLISSALPSAVGLEPDASGTWPDQGADAVAGGQQSGTTRRTSESLHDSTDPYAGHSDLDDQEGGYSPPVRSPQERRESSRSQSAVRKTASPSASASSGGKRLVDTVGRSLEVAAQFVGGLLLSAGQAASGLFNRPQAPRMVAADSVALPGARRARVDNYRRRTPDRRGGSVVSRNMILALLLAAAVLGGAFILPATLRGCGGQTSAQTLDRAESLRLKAIANPDRSAMRAELSEADKLAAQVLAQTPGDKRAQTLRESVAADLSRMDAVFRLDDLRPVAVESNFTGGVHGLGRLALFEDKLLALDRRASRVHRFTLMPSRDRLAGKEPSALEFGDRGPSQIVALIRMPEGASRSQAATLILDTERKLWEMGAGNQLSPLQLKGARTWGSFQSARGYDGSLYILDAKSSQVWRYSPTSDGYNGDPQGLVQKASLGDGIDLAVDGNVYVLALDGKIWKIAGGAAVALSLAGLDKPLTGPTAIFTSRGSNYLYVADAGNRRIVVLDKDGNFNRQLSLPADVAPQDVFVDELSGLIYIAGEKGIYVASVP